MEIESLYIPVADGFNLAATLYKPVAGKTGKDYIVLINPAAAVKRSFYDKYGRFLAEQGFSALTFDYRGIGDSRPESLKGFKAYMHDWGEKDIAGVIDWITSKFHSIKLLVVAHSVGGQLVALAGNNCRINAMLLIASQSGYWKLYGSPERYRQFLFSWLAVPALTKVCGYLPVNNFRLGEDLPKDVALEWVKWSRNPQYLFGDEGLPSRNNVANFTAPILAYSFEDDRWATPQAVDSLMEFYSCAQKTRRHVRPEEIGVSSIGHFGFFRPDIRSTLWHESTKWLGQQ